MWSSLNNDISKLTVGVGLKIQKYYVKFTQEQYIQTVGLYSF